MKLKAIPEAMMWLPGFGPGEDPLQLVSDLPVSVVPDLGIEVTPPTVLHRQVKPRQVVKAVWGTFPSDLHDGLAGEVPKFDANLAAITLLKRLEEEGAVPSEEERSILNRYTGWGALQNAFDRWSQGNSAQRARAVQLEDALTEAEFELARASTLNAHYTDPRIIEGVWAGVQRLGFKGGRILDPSAGTGYFIGAMPKSVAQTSTVTMVELDSVSARIAKMLYGQYGVRVHESGFEALDLPTDHYDLVITNVPFGDYSVVDRKNPAYGNFSIHNYFIAKALEVVRPGGLVAVVTSAFTLDSIAEKHRLHFARSANLVGAFRLPSSAFTELAGADVTTDILFFKKHSSIMDVPEDADWIDCNWPVPRTAEIADQTNWPWGLQTARPINRYFASRPQAIVGKLGLRSGRYGQEYEVVGADDWLDGLAARMQYLPEGIYTPCGDRLNTIEVPAAVFMVKSAEFIKPGAYVLHEGQLGVSLGSEIRIVEGELPKARLSRIKAVLPVRDAVRRLLAVQVSVDNDQQLVPYRIALNAAYDKFVRKHGFLSLQTNVRAFRDDPDTPLLLSLEIWDEESGTATKADIFTKRTVGVSRKVERCETHAEALQVCLAESARVVPSRIAELLEQEEQVAMDRLLADRMVYLDPESLGYQERGEYLSGNVRKKLAIAQAAGGDFETNAEDLAKIIPVDIPNEEIAVRLGSSWVPIDDYAAFMEQVVGYSNATVKFSRATGAWDVSGTGWDAECIAKQQKYGTSRVPAVEMVKLCVNQQSPKVTDPDPTDEEGKRRIVNTEQTLAAKEKQEALKEAFVEWIWSDPERSARLGRIYNDQFNSVVERSYDGTHLTLPGFSTAWTLRPHQKNAVWRILSSGGNTLLAHEVGAGKTLTMICAGMEMRRTGKAKKPLYVVPNHMLHQFAAEFLRAYPAANVLLATKEDMTPDRRRLLLSRIATGDWDAVVITHSSFEKIGLDPAYVATYIKGIVADIVYAVREAKRDGQSATVKQLEKLKKTWTRRLDHYSNQEKKEDMLTFDELGCDFCSIDEAHYFKNLYRLSRMRISGLPSSDSKRSFDMLLKVRYIEQMRGRDDGIVFATATPIANSVAEMWVMQFYLQHWTLEAHGLHVFDTWAANFGQEVTAMELSPDGSSYRMFTRFARFTNMPELMSMFREVADIQTAEMLKLPVPEVIAETVTASASDAMLAYVEHLVERADAIRSGRVKPNVDNMLAVTNDGRKAATDVRLVGLEEDRPGSKINLAVENIHRIWDFSQANRGTQLVFLDLSTPGPGKGWSLYEDMKAKLCGLGIPEAEIAFIHDAESDTAKEALFKATREGRVRVLFGSTSKMGVGTNVQTRVIALHDIDAPWRPADVQQRKGRGVRQGNLNKVIRLYRYVTEKSFDAYTWQGLERKARFIAQVFSGDRSIRSIEDAEMTALSFAEIKALASGNPLVIEKAGVDAEVAKLSMLRSLWQSSKVTARRELGTLPREVERWEALAATIASDRTTFSSAKDLVTDARGRVVEGEDALKQFVIDLNRPTLGVRQVGAVNGFSLWIETRATFGGARSEVILRGDTEYKLGEPRKTVHGLMALLGSVAKVLEEKAEAAAAGLRSSQGRLEVARLTVEASFDQEERFQAAVARKDQIDRELGLFEGDGSVEVDVEVQSVEAA